jgi:hypothetical protein
MSSWSKEAIFGLLAVVVAILLPTIAFLIRYLFAGGSYDILEALQVGKVQYNMPA